MHENDDTSILLGSLETSEQRKLACVDLLDRVGYFSAGAICKLSALMDAIVTTGRDIPEGAVVDLATRVVEMMEAHKTLEEIRDHLGIPEDEFEERVNKNARMIAGGMGGVVGGRDDVEEQD